MPTLNIENTQLFYTIQGQGKPLILMHGWGCSRETVESIARIAAETHKVYSVDFPGFGDSPEPPAVWGVEEYTRLIEQLAAAEGIEAPILIGHSFGGRVGLLFSSRNKVSKLILVDAAGLKPRRTLKYYYKVYTFKLLKRIVKLTHSAKRADEIIAKYRGKKGSADYSSATPMMRAILSKVVNEDLSHLLRDIKAPTLLIWGEEDTATPLYMAKKMEKAIPDAGLVSFKGCGHYSFLDNPIGFGAVLRSFLKS